LPHCREQRLQRWTAIIALQALVLLAGCRECAIEHQPSTDVAASQSVDETPPAGTTRLVEEHWPGGRLKLRRHVVETSDGQLVQHGPLEVWYESGTHRSVGNWANGQKHGHFTFWHENGQPKAEVDYRHGRADGTAIFWDDRGRELRRESWHNGQRVEPTAAAAAPGSESPANELPDE
jgi:hypothetical protein